MGGPGPRDLVRIEPQDPGAPHELVLATRVEEPRLKPRIPATLIRPPHPGTAVRHGDVLYEVVAKAAAGPPFRWRYGLVRIDTRSTIRTILDLDGDGLARWESEIAAEIARRERLARISLLLPLVGCLPANRLRLLKAEVGIDPRHTVVVSCCSFLVLALPLSVYGMITALAGSLGGTLSLGGGDLWIPPIWLWLLADYLTFESVVRLKFREPTGSLPVAIVVALLEETRLLARPPDPSAERWAAREAEAGRSHLVDRVRVLPAVGGAGPELHVESPTRKDWPDGACIRHGERFWLVAEAGEERRQGRAVHVYRLLEAPLEARVRHVVDYRPDQAWLEKQQRDRRDRIDRFKVWKPFLGWLPGEMQLRWAREYGFDARGATAMSAWVELAIAVPNLLVAISNSIYLPARREFEAMAGLTCAFLIVEAVLRLRLLKRTGTPSGSVFLAWVERAAARRRS